MTLTLKQGASVIGTTTTAADGYYEFNGINNGTYSIDVTTSKPVGSINANDAGLVNAWWGTPLRAVPR
ncbi:MAG: hypothetical protein MZV63_56180 [Marinilabiliales bacterium]|nr:hypothetical protein [Marinilabiliales bacterium]